MPVPDDTRHSLYDARDIAGLIEKRSRGRARRAVASSTTDWGEPDAVGDPVRAFGARLARGETLLGFGHRFHPNGDPRCAALLSALPPSPPWLGMIEAAARLTAKRPTVDVALAMLEANLPLPPGGALALFATGRTVGWIAHTLEQRSENRLIRLRAEYVLGWMQQHSLAGEPGKFMAYTKFLKA